MSEPAISDSLFRHVSRALLAALLAGLVAGACLYERAPRSHLAAGEATYLMQAASLVHDFDLVYERADFDRLLIARYGDPRDLELVSGESGRRIAFDRPFPYALWLAPFLALWPANGFAVANALLLVVASLLAARVVERRAGSRGALLVTVLLFASVTFAGTFLATGDLFLFALTVAAFCWLDRPAAHAGESLTPWAGAGALLAIPLATDALYGVLLAAAFFWPLGDQRRRARAALLAGAAAALVATAAVQWLAGGGLPFAAAGGFRFTPETGYPLVDFTAAEWPATLARLRALNVESPPSGLQPRLRLWSLIYLVAGRTAGLVPYFAPLLLLALDGSLRNRRRLIASAAAVWAIAVVALRPTDLAGGEVVIANSRFLPIYGALWLLAGASRARLWRRTAAVVAPVALAAPFLWTLWSEPWDPSFAGPPAREPAYVTSAARTLLPYEAGQRGLGGGAATELDGLWIRPLGEGAWVEARHRRLMLAAATEVAFASRRPLAAIRFERDGRPPTVVALGGGKIGRGKAAPEDAAGFTVRRSGHRRHPLWWAPEARHVYLLTLMPKEPAATLPLVVSAQPRGRE